MNKYVAGFSFRKGHESKSVEGVAGLYRIRAVWIFLVPEIPEGKHERIFSRFFLSEGSMTSNPQPVFSSELHSLRGC